MAVGADGRSPNPSVMEMPPVSEMPISPELALVVPELRARAIAALDAVPPPWAATPRLVLAPPPAAAGILPPPSAVPSSEPVRPRFGLAVAALAYLLATALRVLVFDAVLVVAIGVLVVAVGFLH